MGYARLIPFLLANVLIGAAVRATPPTDPATRDYAPGAVIAQISDKSINESSGVAVSRVSDNVFWTHNDSGDRARFFAFNRAGEVLGDFTVENAGAVDWEDMASFTLDGKNYLLAADVGDNASKRRNCVLWLIEEPEVPAKPGGAAKVRLLARESFTYEGGPRNCESVAVDTARREVVLISKTGGNNCKAYVLPIPSSPPFPKEGSTLPGDFPVAKAIADLSLPTTTGMDISPDGLRAIVVTYTDAWEYTRRADEDWAAGFARAPRKIKLPQRNKGESICYGRDGVTLYLTTEGVPCPLIEVKTVKNEK